MFCVVLVLLMTFVLPAMFMANAWESDDRTPIQGCLAAPSHISLTGFIFYIAILQVASREIASAMAEQREFRTPTQDHSKNMFIFLATRIPTYVGMTIITIWGISHVPFGRLRQIGGQSDVDVCQDAELRVATRGIWACAMGYEALFLLDLTDRMDLRKKVHHLNAIVGFNIVLYNSVHRPLSAYLFAGNALTVSLEWIAYLLSSVYHWNYDHIDVQIRANMWLLIFWIISQLVGHMTCSAAYLAFFYDFIPLGVVVSWSVFQFFQLLIMVFLFRIHISIHKKKMRAKSDQTIDAESQATKHGMNKDGGLPMPVNESQAA